MSTFMDRVCEVQERHIRRLRKWLEVPSSTARRAHLRGGMSPAALRRVQLFVEANLGRPSQIFSSTTRKRSRPERKQSRPSEST